MVAAADDKIFKNQFGEMVLNGAIAVEKLKDGKALQRFISCVGPIIFICGTLVVMRTNCPNPASFHVLCLLPARKFASTGRTCSLPLVCLISLGYLAGGRVG